MADTASNRSSILNSNVPNTKAKSMHQAPTIDEFSIIKPISRGAFGKVYLAQRKGRDKEKLFAIKAMKKSEMVHKNMAAQVTTERDALALAQSPFIVHLYYSIQTNKYIYLVMEYLIGGDVKSLLHVCGYFDERTALIYTAEVVLALEYLHKRNIIHRDLKPDNMLISNEGHIKLTDFGLSKISQDHKLNITDIIGTPSVVRPQRSDSFYRTPGQVLSLTTNLTFETPGSVVEEKFRHQRHTPLSSPLLTTLNRQPPPRPNTHCDSLPDVTRDTRPHTSSHRVNAHIGRDSISVSLADRILSEASARLQGSNEGNPQDEEGSTGQRSARSGRSATRDGGRERDIVFETPVGRAPVNRPSIHLSFSDERGQCTPESNQQSMTSSPTDEGGVLGLGSESRGRKRHLSQVEMSPLSLPSQKGCIRMLNSGSHSGLTTEIRGLSLKLFVADGDGDEESGAVNIGDSCYGSQAMSSGHAGGQGISRNQDDSLRNDEMVGRGRHASEESGLAGDKSIDSLTSDPCTSPVDKWTAEDSDMQLVPLDSATSSHDIKDIPNECKPVEEGQVPTATTGCSSSFCQELSDTSHSGLDLDMSRSSAADPAGKIEVKGRRSSGRKNVSFDLDASVDYKTDASDAKMAVDLSKCCHDNDLELKGQSEPSVVGDGRSQSLLSHQSDSSMKSCDQQERSALSELTNFSPDNTARLNIKPRNASTPGPQGTRHTPLRIVFRTPGNLPYVTPARIRYKTPGRGALITPGPTPLRTPKSCRRRPQQAACGQPLEERILGTPDYLAPELLLQQPHGVGVDWWALGVCLYEFLIGIPPFCDSAPDLVFQNILNRDISWPEDDEAISVIAQDLIENLLILAPEDRPTAIDVKQHEFLRDLDWDHVREMEPPFVPAPDDETDTTYFDARNKACNLDLSSGSFAS